MNKILNKREPCTLNCGQLVQLSSGPKSVKGVLYSVTREENEDETRVLISFLGQAQAKYEIVASAYFL